MERFRGVVVPLEPREPPSTGRGPGVPLQPRPAGSPRGCAFGPPGNASTLMYRLTSRHTNSLSLSLAGSPRGHGGPTPVTLSPLSPSFCLWLTSFPPRSPFHTLPQVRAMPRGYFEKLASQVRVWPAWKCVVWEDIASDPGAPTPSPHLAGAFGPPGLWRPLCSAPFPSPVQLTPPPPPPHRPPHLPSLHAAGDTPAPARYPAVPYLTPI